VSAFYFCFLLCGAGRQARVSAPIGKAEGRTSKRSRDGSG
jgi:hypothetical protein